MVILRVTPQRRYRYLIIVLIPSALCTLTGFILLMSFCHPLDETWLGDLVGGICTGTDFYTTFSYIVSIVTVFTDLGCAIIPGFVIWS